MQTRSENLHHNQHSLPNGGAEHLSPEAELIALAGRKGQTLAEHTLRIIREALELRGVPLQEFVNDVRPHFRNNILNPIGFLINRARHFHRLSRPATAPVPSPKLPSATVPVCEVCRGQKYLIQERDFQPCPACSTAEFRSEWEAKEAERARKRAPQGAK